MHPPTPQRHLANTSAPDSGCQIETAEASDIRTCLDQKSNMYADADTTAQLQEKLSSVDTENNVIQTRRVLRQVLQCATSGGKTDQLFPSVVKFLASSDMVVKKLACWFVEQHGHQTDLLLLAVNSLVKDCQNSNPMMRGLALKTLTGLPQPTFLDYMSAPLRHSLRDQSAYVRRMAVIGCVKIHSHSPEFVLESDIIDTLYGMIRDPDPIVIPTCIEALDEMLQAEGGVVINRSIANYLLNKLKNFNDSGLVTVMRCLKKHFPRTDDEVMDAMNIADVYLKSNNSAVVILTLEYFLNLVINMPHLKGEVYKRAKTQILHCLGLGNHEITVLLLEYIQAILLENKDVFVANHSAFFCKYNEPLYVKERKIEILPAVTNLSNLEEILDELNMYCVDVTPHVAMCSIQAVGRIAQEFPGHRSKCVDKLAQLLETRVEHIASNVLETLQSLDLSEYEQLPRLLSITHGCMDVVSGTKGRCALFSLFGRHGQNYDECPYILQEFIDNDEEEMKSEEKICLLTATVQMFLARPAECQNMLARLLQTCVDSDEVHVRDKAFMYYQLLSADVEEAKKIICVT